MKVVITGASGIQGMSALIYLLEQDDVEKVLITDNFNIDRLKARALRLDDPRVNWKQLDCTDEEVSAATFMGYDCVVNCAHIPGNYIYTTRAALKAGCNYNDLGASREEEAIFARAQPNDTKSETL